ncbi:MAG: hypothetical protein A2Z72_01805 [Omnitrophica bacterium RBG_13_46_9]|nr:MAG: hypothetical protein A2Z72_01805 [Omnitrophica bacterium RBG_13_46_9]
MRALVIDGYNAIHKIPYLRRIMDKSLMKAREEITRLAREYQRKTGGISKVCVIFDGKDEYKSGVIPGRPCHIFSGTGKGDEEVISAVRRLSAEYDVLVVTDDNFVRNNSRAYRAQVIGISKFKEFLEKRQKREPVKNPGRKLTPQAAIEINEDLKRHWGI